MTHKLQLRSKLLIFGAIVVSAGALAGIAGASYEYYCNNCQLPNSGTPAVSATAYHYDNGIELTEGYYADVHIYFYNVSTGNTTCEDYQPFSLGAYKICSNTATARCHVINGTGPRWAICRTEY